MNIGLQEKVTPKKFKRQTLKKNKTGFTEKYFLKVAKKRALKKTFSNKNEEGNSWNKKFKDQLSKKVRVRKRGYCEKERVLAESVTKKVTWKGKRKLLESKIKRI